MNTIPEVGQHYEHRDYGPITITAVKKRGRGYSVEFTGDSEAARYGVIQRLKSFLVGTKAD
jgi:hypothetical protein